MTDKEKVLENINKILKNFDSNNYKRLNMDNIDEPIYIGDIEINIPVYSGEIDLSEYFKGNKR